MVLLGWIFMGTGRPKFKVVAGLVVGFAGVWLLIAGRGTEASGDGQLFGIAAILVATMSWAIGSLYGTRAQPLHRPRKRPGCRCSQAERY